MVKEGASISWADEMDEVAPAWDEVKGSVPTWEDPCWSNDVVRQVKKAPKVRREVHIKQEKTYSHLLPLGNYLAMKLGMKGVKADTLERRYLEEMRRKPGKCLSPTNEEFRKFRVENLETELLQALKLRFESRPKIIFDQTGRAFVVMLALSPNNLYSKEYIPRVEQDEETEEEGSEETQMRGVEDEV